MLHLLHPSLPRTAALDPYRLRHQLLAAATAAVAVTVILGNGLGVAIAVAEESGEQLPLTQTFASASVAAPPLLRDEFTVELRPPLVYPVGAGAPVGSSFGPRAAACGACSTQHQGVDWNPGRGTPIVAIADGVVSKIGPAGSTLGVWLAIDHVVNGQAITSVYGHMEPGSLRFGLGDEVRVGDQVGTVGSTGVTTAPHLHFELRIGGRAINPVPWLRANGAQ